MSEIKTNVMRILEKNKIPYTPHAYPHGKQAPDGVSVAKLLGEDEERVFKTLVTKGTSGAYYVFVLPVAKELNLKKCAAAVGEKSVEMIAVKELLSVTGYVRGGCSPVGMKKRYVTTFHSSARNLPSIIVSAGKIGFQVELNPSDLAKITGGSFAEITA